MPTTPTPFDLLPVFNAQPGATLLLSPDWVILGASDDYLAATLTDRATIVGQYIFDAFPANPDLPEADGVAKVRASLQQVLTTRQPHEMAPQHYDVPDPARPGRFVERHWQPRHTPVLDAAGQVQYILQSVQDITARRLAERQLRESQAGALAARADAERERTEFRHFIEQAPVAVAMYHGPEHRIAMANAAALAIWDRTPDQALHRPVFDVMPETATPEVRALFDRVFTTGTPHTAHEQATTIRRHGRLERVYWNVVFEPQRGPDGRISGLFTVGTDVTAQVQARQQLEQLNQELEARVQARTHELAQAQAETETQRQRLHQLVAEAPALIASLRGPDHVVELANEGFRAIFGGRELVGKTYRDAIPEFAGQPFFDRLDAVYRTGKTYYGIDEPVILDRTNSGQLEHTFITYTYQATRDARGQIDGILVFCYEVTEQVLARQERDQQRQRLHDLFLQAPAAICILDGPDLVYELVNPGYQALFPGRQLHGRSLLDALPEIAGHTVYHTFRNVFDTGETHTERGILVPIARSADGVLEDRYFNYIQQARRNVHGQVDGVLVFAFEVTEQVVARHKAEESQEALKRYQFMADQARDALILMREDGSFAYLNHRALAAWGYPADEAYRLRVPDVDPLHDEPTFAQLFAQLKGTAGYATPGPFETLHRRKDGHVFPVEVSLASLQLGGEPHLLAVARDITDRQQALAALRESEARFRTLADAAPNIVWNLNPDGSVRYVNTYCLAFLGVTLEEFTAHNWLPYLLPEDVAPTQQVLAQAIGERTLFSMEHRMRRHDGQYRWLQTQGGPSYLVGGELYGYVGSAIDITELKQTNEQLVRTNVDLDNFIYTASHDLKAPISNIEGLLYLLKEELPAAVTEQAHVGPTLVRMLDAVERFKRTIDHLTEVSKLQKEYGADSVAVDLPAVIEDVRQDLLPLLKDAGAKLVVDVPPMPAVQFSEKNLRSIVYNLLSNAVKYRSPDRPPRVDVRAHVRPGHTVLEVHDNGLGLAPEYLPKLFTMFQRFHDHVEGTGIGLYMVKRMVENAGGRIEVHSQLRAGTTFFVHLPHAAA